MGMADLDMSAGTHCMGQHCEVAIVRCIEAHMWSITIRLWVTGLHTHVFRLGGWTMWTDTLDNIVLAMVHTLILHSN